MAQHILNKDIRNLVRELERAGWRYSVSTDGHLRLFSPDGVMRGSFTARPPKPRWELARIRSMQRRYHQEVAS